MICILSIYKCLSFNLYSSVHIEYNYIASFIFTGEILAQKLNVDALTRRANLIRASNPPKFCGVPKSTVSMFGVFVPFFRFSMALKEN